MEAPPISTARQQWEILALARPNSRKAKAFNKLKEHAELTSEEKTIKAWDLCISYVTNSTLKTVKPRRSIKPSNFQSILKLRFICKLLDRIIQTNHTLSKKVDRLTSSYVVPAGEYTATDCTLIQYLLIGQKLLTFEALVRFMKEARRPVRDCLVQVAWNGIQPQYDAQSVSTSQTLSYFRTLQIAAAISEKCVKIWISLIVDKMCLGFQDTEISDRKVNKKIKQQIFHLLNHVEEKQCEVPPLEVVLFKPEARDYFIREGASISLATQRLFDRNWQGHELDHLIFLIQNIENLEALKKVENRILRIVAENDRQDILLVLLEKQQAFMEEIEAENTLDVPKDKDPFMEGNEANDTLSYAAHLLYQLSTCFHTPFDIVDGNSLGENPTLIHLFFNNLERRNTKLPRQSIEFLCEHLSKNDFRMAITTTLLHTLLRFGDDAIALRVVKDHFHDIKVDGMTLLHVAACYGLVETTKYLMETDLLLVPNDQGQTAQNMVEKILKIFKNPPARPAILANFDFPPIPKPDLSQLEARYLRIFDLLSLKHHDF